MTDLDTALQRIDFDCPSAALVIRDHIAAQAAELTELREHNQKLTGEKFSDRNHTVLKARAQKAERERDALRALLELCRHPIEYRMGVIKEGCPVWQSDKRLLEMIYGAIENE